MKEKQDAYGQVIRDVYLKGHLTEIVEREDGYIDVGCAKMYFSPYKEWLKCEQKAMQYAQKKVLDIGCGAGRHSLYLQGKNKQVLGIDSSPLAIEVCKKRGLKRTKVMSITGLSRKTGVFDTILMLGNNFGLMANRKRARWLLRKFYHMTTDNAVIIAQTVKPYDTKQKEHLEYHEQNRKKGKFSCQLKIRIRYKKYVSAWFEYLFVSREEMKTILKGTGWKIDRTIDDTGLYIAVIKKE